MEGRKALKLLRKRLKNALVMRGFKEKRCFGKPSKACFTRDCLAFDKDGVCTICRELDAFLKEMRNDEY